MLHPFGQRGGQPPGPPSPGALAYNRQEDVMNVRAQPEEYVSTRAMGGRRSPGIRMRCLAVGRERSLTVLLRADAPCSPGTAPRGGRVFHARGRWRSRGVRAGGTSGRKTTAELVSVIHDHTPFPEETEFLFTNHGAVQFRRAGNTTGVSTEVIQSLAQTANVRAA